MSANYSKRVKDAPPRNSTEDYAGQPEYNNCDTGFFGITVKTFLSRCAGLVDAASVVVIDSCRGEADDSAGKDILGPLFKNKQAKKSKRKHGGILEFPADGELQDDVSALSANTLEEMERLAKIMAGRDSRLQKPYDGTSKPYPGQLLVPPKTASKGNSWARFPAQPNPNDGEESIGVATSGSSSTHEEKIVTENKSAPWKHGSGGVQSFIPQVDHLQAR